jgi:hypothetical protein
MNRNCRNTSLCRACIFHCMAIRIGLNLNTNRWTIISNRIWSSYYNSRVDRTCNLTAPPIIPESPNYKRKSREISNLLWPIVISPVLFVVFLFCSVPLSDKFLISVDTVLRSGVYHMLPANYDSISQSRVINIGVFVGLLFNSLYYATCVFCPQLKPKNIFRFRASIFIRNLE